MATGLYKKGIVSVIIGLFIGASITPIISSDNGLKIDRDANKMVNIDNLKVLDVTEELRCIKSPSFSIDEEKKEYHKTRSMGSNSPSLKANDDEFDFKIDEEKVLSDVFLTSAPDDDWDKKFGGTSEDVNIDVQQTSDGGFIAVGWTESYGNGGEDAWLIKTDTDGNKEWDQTFGGTNDDWGWGIDCTSDNGYIMVGGTYSQGAGLDDGLLVKVKNNGDVDWSKTYGGSSQDYFNGIQQTTDGGYIIVGVTNSWGNGGDDIWLVKTDVSGNKVWSYAIGTSYDDRAFRVQQTTDGGYIFAGYSSAFEDGQQWDALVIKTDEYCNIQWGNSFGGDFSDWIYMVEQTTDGGYMFAGTTGYDYDNPYITGDIMLIKTDANGDLSWSQAYGGSSYDGSGFAQQTSDGGYIINGCTMSYGAGNQDFWLIKTDSSGNMQWDKTFGGTDNDWGNGVQQTTDNGYILSGCTMSYGAGDVDWWLIKLAPEGGNQPPSNPVIISLDGEILHNPTTIDVVVGDMDMDSLSHRVDWGDGTIDDWSEYYNPLITLVSFSHTYNQLGTYEIKIQSKDIHGAESAWSNPITTNIEENQPPNTPSNPSPTDYATGIDINTDLSWTGGDPNSGDTLTYDVYFGTASTPPFVETVTTETYDPGSLNDNTKYYWKILSRDITGTETSGSIWEFTTEEMNNPPNKPSKPDGPTYIELDDPLALYSFGAHATDPDGDNIQYGWDFNGDGNVDKWSDLVGGSDIYNHWILYQWKQGTGTFQVQVKARDSKGASGPWSNPLQVTVSPNNYPPENPVIHCPEEVSVYEIFTLIVCTDDLESDKVSFYVDWGDGTNTGWTDFDYEYCVTFHHNYESEGLRQVQVTAKDEHDSSDTVAININVEYTALKPHSLKSELSYWQQNKIYWKDASYTEIEEIQEKLFYTQGTSVEYEGCSPINCDSSAGGAWSLTFYIESELVIPNPPHMTLGTKGATMKLSVTPDDTNTVKHTLIKSGARIAENLDDTPDDFWKDKAVPATAKTLFLIAKIKGKLIPAVGFLLDVMDIVTTIFPPEEQEYVAEWEIQDSDVTSDSYCAYVNVFLYPSNDPSDATWSVDFNSYGKLYDGPEIRIGHPHDSYMYPDPNGYPLLSYTNIESSTDRDGNGIVFSGDMPPDPKTLPNTCKTDYRVVVYCPVDVSVETPYGGYIDKDWSSMPGATYEEVDLDGDGELDKEINLPWSDYGDYKIYINPHDDADPDDTFSIDVSLDGVTIHLIENMKISDVNPDEPFIYTIEEPEWGPMINGPICCKTDLEYDYNLQSTCLYGLGAYEYFIDWGDGYADELVTGPFDVGEIVLVGHVWDDPGIYEVKVKVQDRLWKVSDWSEPLLVDVTYISQVPFDIKPGSYPNSINPDSNGVTPVAIITNETFDASTVDPTSVNFLDASPLRWALEDVDEDGYIDLSLKFKTQELNFSLLNDEGDEYPYAYITGETVSGETFFGKDTVRLVGQLKTTFGISEWLTYRFPILEQILQLILAKLTGF